MGEKLESTEPMTVLPLPASIGSAGPSAAGGAGFDAAEYERVKATPMPKGMENAQVGADGTWHGWNKETNDAVAWNKDAHVWERVTESKPPGWWDASGQLHEGKPTVTGS